GTDRQGDFDYLVSVIEAVDCVGYRRTSICPTRHQAADGSDSGSGQARGRGHSTATSILQSAAQNQDSGVSQAPGNGGCRRQRNRFRQKRRPVLGIATDARQTKSSLYVRVAVEALALTSSRGYSSRSTVRSIESSRPSAPAGTRASSSAKFQSLDRIAARAVFRDGASAVYPSQIRAATS